MDELGIEGAPSSGVLRDAVRANFSGRSATVPELINLGAQFKSQFGADVLIRWTLLRMFNLPEESWRRITIDGLRTEEELGEFRKLFGDRAVIVFIKAPSEDILWQRIQ